jgi:hypothetical protein
LADLRSVSIGYLRPLRSICFCVQSNPSFLCSRILHTPTRMGLECKQGKYSHYTAKLEKIHSTCTVHKIITKKLFHHEGCKLPNKNCSRSPFSTYSYTRSRWSFRMQHPFSFTRFLCLTAATRTISFRKSSRLCWDFVYNCFIATAHPFGKVPCKDTSCIRQHNHIKQDLPSM